MLDQLKEILGAISTPVSTVLVALINQAAAVITTAIGSKSRTPRLVAIMVTFSACGSILMLAAHFAGLL